MNTLATLPYSSLSADSFCTMLARVNAAASSTSGKLESRLSQTSFKSWSCADTMRWRISAYVLPRVNA